MANEIRKTVALLGAKGGAAVSSTGTGALDTQNINMAGVDMGSQTQIVTTAVAGELLIVPAGIDASVHPTCQMLVRNMDATNILELSTTNTNQAAFEAARFASIVPGDCACWPPYSKTIYGRALVASVVAFVEAIEA